MTRHHRPNRRACPGDSGTPDPFVEVARRPDGVGGTLTPARRRPWRRVLWPWSAAQSRPRPSVGWSPEHIELRSRCFLSATPRRTARSVSGRGADAGRHRCAVACSGLRVADPWPCGMSTRRSPGRCAARGTPWSLPSNCGARATGARHWSGEFRSRRPGALAVGGECSATSCGSLQPRAADSIDLRKLQRTTRAPMPTCSTPGRYFLGRRSGESIARARGLFAQAIERDPV